MGKVIPVLYGLVFIVIFALWIGEVAGMLVDLHIINTGKLAKYVSINCKSIDGFISHSGIYVAKNVRINSRSIIIWNETAGAEELVLTGVSCESKYFN